MREGRAFSKAVLLPQKKLALRGGDFFQALVATCYHLAIFQQGQLTFTRLLYHAPLPAPSPPLPTTRDGLGSRPPHGAFTTILAG